MQATKVSVAEILGQPGHHRDLTVRARLGGVENALGRLSTEPVEADLRAESVVEGILVTGAVHATADMSCARCLEPVPSELRAEVCELFATPGHELPPEEEAYEVEGLDIDLEPMMRDALVLALPLHPVCTDGCRGMCAGCGKNLNNGECECETEEIDPRWAGLSELRERLG